MSPPSRSPNSRPILPLLILFGSLYFVQGIVEPGACLPAQPMQSDLRAWGFSPTEVGHFFGIIGIAWSIKPLFGLISDFFPLAGYRRWPYLVLSTALTALVFFGLAAIWSRPTPQGTGWASFTFDWLVETAAGQPRLGQLGWLLVLAGVGIAMTDVAMDALAVETGQPLGITGQIQSVQWAALSLGSFLAGVLGGLAAQYHWQRQMFLTCGVLAMFSLTVVLLVVREPRNNARPRENLRLAWRQLLGEGRLATLLSVSAFLFLWSFNPFSTNVQQEYFTKELGLSEVFYGSLISIQGVGMVVACLAYGWYCRKVSLTALIHLAIVTGVASTLTYWLVHDQTTAVIASLVFGLAYQTGLLVQLDLAARVCPTQSAGTIFALLMALSNSGTTAGIYLGGGWYDALTTAFGSRTSAYHILVAIGAAFTAGCWLLVPLMKWAGSDKDFRI